MSKDFWPAWVPSQLIQPHAIVWVLIMYGRKKTTLGTEYIYFIFLSSDVDDRCLFLFHSLSFSLSTYMCMCVCTLYHHVVVCSCENAFVQFVRQKTPTTAHTAGGTEIQKNESKENMSLTRCVSHDIVILTITGLCYFLIIAYRKDFRCNMTNKIRELLYIATFHFFQ